MATTVTAKSRGAMVALLQSKLCPSGILRMSSTVYLIMRPRKRA